MTTTTPLDTLRQVLIERHPDYVDPPTQVALKALARLETHLVSCEHMTPEEVSYDVIGKVIDAINFTYAIMSLPDLLTQTVFEVAKDALVEEFGDEIVGNIPLEDVL